MLQLIDISVDGQPSEGVYHTELISLVCEAMSQLYGRVGFQRPWVGYLVILDGVVGTCSFKSPPINKQVKIAYFTFPGFEGCGIGTAMAQRLIEVAEMAEHEIVVLAQTLPEENASTRILRKLGFAHKGIVVHPDD